MQEVSLISSQFVFTSFPPWKFTRFFFVLLFLRGSFFESFSSSFKLIWIPSEFCFRLFRGGLFGRCKQSRLLCPKPPHTWQVPTSTDLLHWCPLVSQRPQVMQWTRPGLTHVPHISQWTYCLPSFDIQPLHFSQWIFSGATYLSQLLQNLYPSDEGRTTSAGFMFVKSLTGEPRLEPFWLLLLKHGWLS